MKVTVYIPTKNRLLLLQRAIESVQTQTYKDIELIVVDDGSTDGSRDYLRNEMESGRLKAFFHEKSLGGSAARNTAIKHAQGGFVTGLDDDDYFLSRYRIEWFVETWAATDTKIAGIFDSIKVQTRDEGVVDRHLSGSVDYYQIRRQNLVGNQIFAPRKHFLESGLFDVEMPAWQDWDLWIRMAEKFGPFINIKKFSYMMDHVHDAERVTVQNGENIRIAMLRLTRKLAHISWGERASLIETLYAYPQVKPKLAEVGILLMSLRTRLALRSMRKMLA